MLGSTSRKTRSTYWTDVSQEAGGLGADMGVLGEGHCWAYSDSSKMHAFSSSRFGGWCLLSTPYTVQSLVLAANCEPPGALDHRGHAAFAVLHETMSVEHSQKHQLA